jgi:hypothetical protein
MIVKTNVAECRNIDGLSSLLVFGLKCQAVFALHGAADLNNWYLPAFKSHGTTSMRKVDFPGHEIVNASMTGRIHYVLCQLSFLGLSSIIVYIELNQLLAAILDCGLRIADLLYRLCSIILY